MISDDERREVAEDLRDMAIRPHIQYKEQFFDELAEVVVGFEDFHDFNVVLEKLADLIDPTCRLLPSPDGGFGCNRCFTWFPSMKEKPNFCPECGARVVDDD